MTLSSALQYVAFIVLLTVCVKPFGAYMERVFSQQPTALDRALVPIERKLYQLARVDPEMEMTWVEYACSFALFTFVGTLLLYFILRLQRFLPFFFPEYQPTSITPDLEMNTAVSFSTTTTWQAYGGETTMSYVSQIVGLCVQNFLAGAAGLAVGIAFIRGFARQRSGTLGNFWVDLVRSLLWILLPLSIVGSLLLVAQGVPLNWHHYTVATTLAGQRQVIAQGPVALLEIIKNLGTNGGGFFNANGAHPFENPTPLSNLVEMLAIAILPAALTYTLGKMIGKTREGWTLYFVMLILFASGLSLAHIAEQQTNPAFNNQAIQHGTNPGGNMEGKEVRFGIGGSVLTAAVTSNTATGSYNSAHDSYTPLGGLVLIVNLLLGEMVFGGLGTGIYSIILVAVIAVFLTGLMIGRTPEYLGKKIGPPENKMIMLYTLASPIAILCLAALAVTMKAGLAGLTTNQGPHGLTEIVFNFSSCFANNGQSFAGMNVNSPFYNVTTAIAMMMGRFGLAVPALGLAGLCGRQTTLEPSLGTLKTDSFTFGVVLTLSALLITGLNYFPALSLGPILEHLGR